MYSDPMHEDIEHEHDPLEDCFERAMMEERPIEDCFSDFGEEVIVWPNGDEHHCARRVVIKADDMVHMGYQWDLVNMIRDYIRRCPMVEKITILGSEYAMKELKVVTGNCGKRGDFGGFIAGINVLKTPPIRVCCMSKRGSGPTSHVERVVYY